MKRRNAEAVMSPGNSLLRVHIQKELPRGRIYLH